MGSFDFNQSTMGSCSGDENWESEDDKLISI